MRSRFIWFLPQVHTSVRSSTARIQQESARRNPSSRSLRQEHPATLRILGRT